MTDFHNFFVAPSVANWLDHVPTPNNFTLSLALLNEVEKMANDDPWDWSVDRVVQELCTDKRSWQPRTSTSSIPDPARLEGCLRDQEISGDILLMDIDDTVLKDDFGLKTIRWRSFVRHAISELRLKSIQYKAYVEKHRSTGMLGSSHQVASGSLLAPSSTHEYSGNQTDLEPASKRQKVDHVDIDDTLLHQDQDVEEQIGMLPTPTEWHATQISDGKKRKRIAPTLITTHIDPNRSREIPTAADNVIKNIPQRQIEPGVQYTDSDGKKRVAPIHISDATSGEPRRSEDLRQPSFAQTVMSTTSVEKSNDARIRQILGSKFAMSGYLGRKAIPVDEVFYKDIAVGEQFVEEETKDFGIGPHWISAGKRLYINNMMKRFHRTQRYDFMRGSERFSGIRPYPEKLITKFQNPSFTLYYSSEGGRIHARREHIHSWPEVGLQRTDALENASDSRSSTFHPLGPDMLSGPSSYDTWDPSFLEKYKCLEGGDTVLPLYGESDEENEYDLATWKEMEEERGAKLDRPYKLTRRNRLDSEQVNEAIEEGVTQLVAKWNLKVLPKREKRAWSIWMKSRKRGTKRVQIAEAQRGYDLIYLRIEKLRKEITTEIWTSKLQVLKQTNILEPSVFDREDLSWKMSVLERNSPPEKPPAIVTDVEARASAGLLERSVDEREGESLESDERISSSEDGLDDFIVTDDEISVIEEGMGLDLADSEHENGEEDIISDAICSTSSSPDPVSSTTKFITPSRKSRQATESQPFTPSSAATRSEPNENSGLSLTTSVKDEDIHLPDLLPMNGRPEMIDLTLLSSDDAPASSSRRSLVNLVTPTKKRTLFKFKTRNSQFNVPPISLSEDEDEALRNENALAPYHEPSNIAKYTYDALGRIPDRERLVIKVIYEMTDEEKIVIFDFISHISQDQLWASMCQILEGYMMKIKRVKGIDARTSQLLTTFARLYQIYSLGQFQAMWDQDSLPSLSSLQAILDSYDQWFTSFYKFCRCLEEYFQNTIVIDRENDASEDDEEVPRTANRRQAKPLITLSDEDILDELTPRKRKKPLLENREAKDMRDREMTRRAEQNERREKLHAARQLAGYGDAEEHGTIIINDAAIETQGLIYVNEHVARSIKKHQIEGLRFLWNQTITEDKKLQGCLLAHTMGLGKTMQVITLLVAIAEASNSDTLSISSQIPDRLKISKTLVLCPPTLIDNWMDELLTWVRPDYLLGDFWKVDASISLTERLQTISRWYEIGGVLLIGYEMFRAFIINKETNKRKAVLNEEQHEQVLKELLEGPNIVIADEAHKMKNATTDVTKAAARFDTRCRIALTGSPLANNVEEYHTMIEWVTPNYLGPAREFREKYVEPIQTGLYGDSSKNEKRLALKMLSVLNKELSPKVHRADMAVLKHDLPRKTEFTITVPLTELQKKAYTLYVRAMTTGGATLTKDGEVAQTTLWHWLAILSLLCNHPACFQAKLTERKEDAQRTISAAKSEASTSREGTDADEVSAADINPPIWKVGVSQALIDGESKLFREEAGDIYSIDLSNKAKILCQILDAAKAAGDKTLVFSQSIPTLDFLENLCRGQNRRYSRLDGKTKMNTRQAQTKEFNNASNRTEIYLISTQAGGLGLNLPGANRVIIFDFKFNPIQEEQAIGRAYRIGQTKETFVYRFVAGGTFEESIHNKTIFKQQLASRVVDKKRPMAMAKKRLGDFLFEPKDVEQKDLSQFSGIDPLVLDTILATQAHSSTIRAIVQSDTFEREDNDKLTAEEEREVELMYNDEKLKRSNPLGWATLLQQRQQAALRPRASPYHHEFTSSQQVHDGRTNGSVILPPTPNYRFAKTGSAQTPPGLSSVHNKPSSIPSYNQSHHGEARSVSNSRPESGVGSAEAAGRSPILSAGTQIRASTPAIANPLPDTLIDPPASAISYASSRNNEISSTEDNGVEPALTATNAAGQSPILSASTRIRASTPAILETSSGNMNHRSQVVPNGSQSNTQPSPFSRAHENRKEAVPLKDVSDASQLSPGRKFGIRMPSSTYSATPDSSISPVKRGTLNKLFRDTAVAVNVPEHRALSIYKEVKTLAKKRAPNPQSYESIFSPLDSKISIHCRALLIGTMEVEAFVHELLGSSTARRRLDSSDEGEKSEMFLVMSRQPVQSLRTPVAKTSKGPKVRLFAKADAAQAKAREEEHRASNSNRDRPIPRDPKIPHWAREEINEAQARDSNPHKSTPVVLIRSRTKPTGAQPPPT